MQYVNALKLTISGTIVYSNATTEAKINVSSGSGTIVKMGKSSQSFKGQYWQFNGKFIEVERMEYDKAVITKTDIKYGMKYQYETGVKDGVEKGRAEGLQEGIERGKAEGYEKGVAEGRLEIARNFLKQGLSLESIAAGTGLDIEQVRKLAAI